MRKLKLNKLIASTVLIASAIALNPLGASAEWKSNSTGFWYAEGSSYITGWKEISGQWYYFDSNGYMKTGWIYDNGNWYYCLASGQMAKDTTVGGCYLNRNGAWIINKNNTENYAFEKSIKINYSDIGIKNGILSVRSTGDSLCAISRNDDDKYIEFIKKENVQNGVGHFIITDNDKNEYSFDICIKNGEIYKYENIEENSNDFTSEKALKLAQKIKINLYDGDITYHVNPKVKIDDEKGDYYNKPYYDVKVTRNDTNESISSFRIYQDGSFSV